MGQGLGSGQLRPSPPSTSSFSPTIVGRPPPPPQSEGAAIQSHDSGSDDAKPGEVRPILPSSTTDAAESQKFGTTTLLHPESIIQCMGSGCTVRTIRPSIVTDDAESQKFGTMPLLHPATIIRCMDSRCTVKPTAKPDMAPPPTVESLCSKFKTLTLVRKPEGEVSPIPPSIIDSIEVRAGIRCKRDSIGSDVDGVKSDMSPSTANFELEQKLDGWDYDTKFNTPLSTVNAVGYGSTILEQKLDGAGIQGGSTGWGWDVGQLRPTGWDDGEESGANGTGRDGVQSLSMETGWDDGMGSGANGTGWDGVESLGMKTGWNDGVGLGANGTGWDGVESLSMKTGWDDGVESGANGTEWDGVESLSMKALEQNPDVDGISWDETAKDMKPTWWGVEVKPTGWEDKEISEKAVPMTNKDGNGEGVKYPTWRGVEVKPTGWEGKEISEKAVPMTNKDRNGEGVKYPAWCGVEMKPPGWEDGERSDKAVLKPNKDGSCEGVKYPQRSAVKYPERPGQPDCSFYVNTGTCKFGLNCKFNHSAIRKTRTKVKQKKPPEPIQTGISKVPMASNTEEPVLGLATPFHCPPASVAAEACPQSKILKEEKLEGKAHRDCYHGPRPEGKSNSEESVSSNEGKSETDFPQRPGKPDCSYYLNTGNCQYGSNCWFNHPLRRKGNKKDVKEHIRDAPLGKTGNLESKACKGKPSKALPGRTGQTERKINTRQYSVPASKHAHFPGKTVPDPVELNFLGLPMRPGEKECTNYMHTGVCKYATNCRFHHPNPTPVAAEDILSASQNVASSQQHTSGASAPLTTSWTSNASCGPLPYPSLPYTPEFYPLPPQGVYRHPGWSGYQVPPSLGPGTVSGNSSASKLISEYGHVATDQPRQTFDNLERPDQRVCHSFIKTGYCKFRSACRYHHPKMAPDPKTDSQSAR